MAFTPGFKAHILLDNAAGTPVDVSVYADDFSFPQNTELLDTTVFGTAGFKRVIPGLTGGDSISFSGPLDTVVYTQIAAMKAAQLAGTLGFTLVYSPAGSVASAPKISGEVYVGEFSISSGVAGRNEFSASLQVDGAITNSAW
jgi:hypothetical protein